LVRVVLDTNVLISAFFWEGNERALLDRCRSGEVRSVTSPEIIDEAERVLIRKFGAPGKKVKVFLWEVIGLSEIVFPRGDLRVVEEDPADDIVIETAILGRADVIATGDRHLLRIGKHRGVDIKGAKGV
jgi:putative PIN family toxin of toxin-antitoxin system